MAILVESKFFINSKDKPTILFLHGFGGGFESFEGIYQEFQETHNIILIKFNSNPEMPVSIFDYAEDTLKILNENDLKDVSIIAHSFGVRVAVVLASKNYDIFSKMVFVGGAGIKPKFSFKKVFKIVNYKVHKFLVKVKVLEKISLERFGSLDYKTLTNSGRKTFINVVNKDLKPLLNKITNKTLILVGSKDFETPIYMAKIFNKKIKNSELIIIENGNHFWHIYDRSRFVLLVKMFFQC